MATTAPAAPKKPLAPSQATKTFPCTSCGAKLEFQPGLAALKCPYCGAESAIPQADAPSQHDGLARHGYDAMVAEAPEEPAIPRQKVKCPSCSAETELTQNVVSDRCAYCKTPVIATQGYAERKIKPGALAPFVIKEADAKERFKTWVKSLWFAPSALKKLARADRGLKGTYVPYFTYDSQTYTPYSGERGTVYYDEQEVEVNGKRETKRVERVDWQRVTGAVSVEFEDLAVVASMNLPEEHADHLEPWELDKLVAYTDQYVSGFTVEAYQRGLKAGFDKARELMESDIKDAVTRDIGGDRQRIHSMSPEYNDTTFRHLLLPLWVSAYQYGSKTYRFLVNGQTGLVRGERPYSAFKIALAVAGALGLIYVIYQLAN